MKFLMWVFVLLNLMHVCTLIEFTYNEGDFAVVQFPFMNYTNQGAYFELRIREGLPFYKAGINKNGNWFGKSQYERFNVDVVLLKSGLFQVRILIKNISREDGATYYLDMFQLGEKIDELSKHLNINIQFSPGNASCGFEDTFLSSREPQIKLLNCQAKRGFHDTIITCFQNHEKLPTFDSYIETIFVFYKVWVYSDQNIYCCSSTSIHTKQIHDCFDFVWHASKQPSKTRENTSRPTYTSLDETTTTTYEEDKTVNENVTWKIFITVNFLFLSSKVYREILFHLGCLCGIIMVHGLGLLGRILLWFIDLFEPPPNKPIPRSHPIAKLKTMDLLTHVSKDRDTTVRYPPRSSQPPKKPNPTSYPITKAKTMDKLTQVSKDRDTTVRHPLRSSQPPEKPNQWRSQGRWSPPVRF